ncbi:transketolase family protein [Isoptericola variabilis]|uniref:Transketolase central region n=1 Tax=Isoptericola variabilis (strain 225) TaxID=743718 RepID=F6FSB1_ISOV2|nr:transketolase [Isoptericola variabilis]AEG43052.1 Transketolase central region [Isoptericola variabilis 225]TWH29979.1 transketolase subunit B [Isoptericola variabilis J7]
MSMRDRFYAELDPVLERHPDAVVVLAVIGAAQASRASARHPGRVVDVGIREQAMVGVAGGLALAGLRPIVHTYAPFLVERAYEQVKLDLGHQDVGALLVSTGASYDASTAGRTHQAPADVALVAALPGWGVHVPGHADELAALVHREAGATGRAYVRMSAQHNARAYPVDGRLHLVRDGGAGSPLVVAVGPMLDTVLAAVADLPVRVAYTATPHPLDTEGLRALAGPVPALAVVEPYLEGTSAHAVAAALADRPSRAVHVGVPRDAELRRYGTPRDHAAAHGLDAAGVRRRVKELLG